MAAAMATDPHNRMRVFDEQLVQQICDYIEAGNYIATACHAVGITQTTYYKWLGIGQDVNAMCEAREDADDLKERMMQGEMVLDFTMAQVRCFEFRERVLKSSARSEAFAVAMVRKHMPDQWTAAMTFLERRFPNRWKRREQIDVGEGDANAGGIDETLLLSDPEAVKLVHDALDKVASGRVTIDGTADEIPQAVLSPTPAPASDESDDEKSPPDQSTGQGG